MNYRLRIYLVIAIYAVFGNWACKHNTKPYGGPDKPRIAGPTSTDPGLDPLDPGIKPGEPAKPLDCQAIQANFKSSSRVSVALTIPKMCKLDLQNLTINADMIVEEGGTLNLKEEITLGDKGSLTHKGTPSAPITLHYANGCPRIDATLGARFTADNAVLSGETKTACPTYKYKPFLDADLAGTLSNVKFQDILVPIFEITDQLRLAVSSYQTERTQILAQVSGSGMTLMSKLNPIPAQSFILLKLDFAATPQIRLSRNSQYSYVIGDKVEVGNDEGASLIVDAGVKAYFMANGGITVGRDQKGQLQVNGTTAEPVTFTHMLRTANLIPTTQDLWYGISVGKWATTVTIANLKMSYASTTSTGYFRESTRCSDNNYLYGGCIELQCDENALLASLNRQVSITNSTMENCYKAGLIIEDRSDVANCGFDVLEVSNNTFGPGNWFGLTCRSFEGACSIPQNNTSTGLSCP